MHIIKLCFMCNDKNNRESFKIVIPADYESCMRV